MKPAAALLVFEVGALVGTALRAGYRGGRRFESTAASHHRFESMALYIQKTTTIRMHPDAAMGAVPHLVTNPTSAERCQKPPTSALQAVLAALKRERTPAQFVPVVAR